MIAFISRRNLIKTAAAVLAMGAIPRVAFASDDESLVQFSPDVAIDFAEQFVDAAAPDKAISVSTNPIPMFSAAGELRGYLLSFTSMGDPSGYLLLDTMSEGLVSQFSLSEGARDPYSLLTSKIPNNTLLLDDAPALVIYDPFVIGAADRIGGSVVTNDGMKSLGNGLIDTLNSNSSGSDTWWDVWIKSSSLNSSYSVVSEDYCGDLMPVPESAPESAIKRYACGVHALYIIGGSITTDDNSSFVIPELWDNWEEYNRLWRYTNTYTDKYENGIEYGMTNDSAIGSGFQQYCKYRNKTLSYNHISNAAYSSFVSYTNKGRPFVVGAGISTKKGESGHFMAGNGYAQLRRRSDGTTLHCLSIYNGWEDFVMFNYDFSRFTWRSGTFFDW